MVELSANLKFAIFAGSLLIHSSCFGQGRASFEILESHTLPQVLFEISGITDIGDGQVACVQDEGGTIFIYDLAERRISERRETGLTGDFEDIAWTGQQYFLLESPGVLYEVSGSGESVTSTRRDIGISAKNSEGLAFDPATRRLLVVPKSKAGKGKEYKHKVVIWPVSLDGFALQDPLAFDLSKLKDTFALSQGKRERRWLEKPRFRPSALAVDPRNGEYWLLSSAQGLLLNLDRDMSLKRYLFLHRKRFPKPEGVFVFGNGDLWISSEGFKERPASLTRIRLSR